MNHASAYSRIDRLLHRMAFSGTQIQVALADIEDQVYARNIPTGPVARPVFVTALPRAGTTLLLEAVASLPEFATHTYRHMPFVLCPLLWDAVSRGLRHQGAPRERAHGDGVMVDFDSPEAFEEVVWKAFWPDCYKVDRITPWPGRAPEEFATFLDQHMRKVAALSGAGGEAGVRYASKNNASIARLDLLARMFPDGAILVPFRNPVDHAASLMQQHANFRAIHATDRFARDYMAYIGHFEFGDLLRPIDFDGWIDAADAISPDTVGFWLAYWVAAYAHILAAGAPNVVLLDYDACCASARTALGALADVLDVADRDAMTAQAGRFRAPTVHDREGLHSPPALLHRALDLHEELKVAALI